MATSRELIMLTTCVLLASMVQGDQGQTPGQLVSKMLARYNAAKSLTGEIVLTQSAGEKQLTAKTAIQIDRPDKLYVRQDTRFLNEPRTFLIVSDGKRFAYDVPMLEINNSKGKRLLEPMSQAGRQMNIGDVYAAASLSIQDRSAPLDIAISRGDDLKFLKGQWADMEFHGKEEINGKTARLIVGAWRENPRATPSGRYQMAITDDGELLRYATQITIQIENVGTAQVTSVWKVNLDVNGKPNASLFTVR